MAKILTYNSPPGVEKKLSKESPFNTLWEKFQSSDKFTKFYILAFLLIVVATPFLVNNLLETRQRAQEQVPVEVSLEDQAKSQTLEVLRNSNNLHRNPKSVELTDKLKGSAKNRKEKFKELMVKNPKLAARIAISKEQRDEMPEDIRDSVEETTTIEGTLDVLHFMYKDGRSTEENILTDQNGKKYSLKFMEKTPEGLGGKKVKIKGVVLDDKIIPESIDSEDVKVLGAQTSKVLGATTGPIKVAVILINFQDDTSTDFSQDSMRTLFFTGPQSLNAYNTEVSFGKANLVGYLRSDGDIFGYYTVLYSKSTCDYNAYSDAAKQKAVADGFVDANYDHVAFVFSHSLCSWGGLGLMPGKYTWFNNWLELSFIGHEFGHNLGFAHSNHYECTENGVRTSITGVCTVAGNDVRGGIMGGGPSNFYHVHNINKGTAGWWDPANYQTITTSGTYTLIPIEQASSGVQTIRIKRQGTSQYYYLEFRQPYGWDNFPSTEPVANGIGIRLTDLSGTTSFFPVGKETYLIDTTPATTAMEDAALTVGQTFTDVPGGVTIKTLSVSPIGASVQITLSGPTCTQANPTVSLSPLSNWGGPGEPLQYTLTLTNNDSSPCSSSTFNINPSLPSGFTQASVSPITVDPGRTSTVNISITSPLSIADGFYSFTETAVDSSSPTHTNSASANYNVLSPGPGFIFCALEGQTCSFSGTAQVAFGANGMFNYGTYTNSVLCSWSVFGDPLYGVAKACYYNPTTSTTTPTPTPTLIPTPTFVPITQPAGIDKTLPTVSITAPINGAIVARNFTITLQAIATDNVAIAHVDFLVNGALVCSDTTSPYSCNWKTSGKPNASYTISVKAYDTSGNTSSVSVTVKSTK